MSIENRDEQTIASFGTEWTQFDQSALSALERRAVFEKYFAIFPWDELPPEPVGADIGCGSGRWALEVAPRVGKLYCVDASTEALEVAKKLLENSNNVSFIEASVDAVPLPSGSLDFCYSLGVLHHVPRTVDAIKKCAELLKPGAPLLVYLYYRFDNRPLWFRGIWRLADLLRKGIVKMPEPAKVFTTDVIAALAYWPLARICLVIETLGIPVSGIPLSFYRRSSFYTMRTDSRDRFGTPLEQRFALGEIVSMMAQAGLERIEHSSGEPFWCVVGRRARAC